MVTMCGRLRNTSTGTLARAPGPPGIELSPDLAWLIDVDKPAGRPYLPDRAQHRLRGAARTPHQPRRLKRGGPRQLGCASGIHRQMRFRTRQRSVAAHLAAHPIHGGHPNRMVLLAENNQVVSDGGVVQPRDVTSARGNPRAPRPASPRTLDGCFFADAPHG